MNPDLTSSRLRVTDASRSRTTEMRPELVLVAHRLTGRESGDSGHHSGFQGRARVGQAERNLRLKVED